MFNWSSYFPITDPTWTFFIVLCIILLAPMIMNRLRIPHIIGMVLAGVLVGKYGLGILERDASFEQFGQVGLYYIMFLAGLEMDMGGLQKYLKRMLVLGALTFLVPFIMVYAVGISLMDYSIESTLLLCCIMSSNTLIAYPIVCKYGLQKHQSVIVSVGGSMLALLLALLSLSAVVGTVSGGGDAAFWMLMLLKLAAYTFVMLWLVPRGARWFLQHYSDGVMQFVFVLSVLFLSSAFSSLAGLEGVFGAFMAGLALGRYIPRVSPLMGRLEFTGNALFIPYFLIGVGMLINLRELFSGWHTAYIVLCMVVFGTLGKMVAAYVAKLILGLPMRQGHMMFGLTSAHAAGSIAIAMVGMSLQVEPGKYLVDGDMLNGVVMMILFTCIISSVMTDYASRNIVLYGLPTDDADEPRGDDEKILIPLRYQGNMESLVSLAVMMRNPKLNRGIIGLNVVLDDDNVQKNQQRGKQILEQATKLAAQSNVRMQTQSRIATNVSNGILHAFMEYDASEIIIGLHRKRSETDNFWGVFTENLYSESDRQITIVKMEQPLSTIRRIQVIVPSRAEYEPGFHRWMDRLGRMASNMGCRIQYHGRGASLDIIKEYMQQSFSDLRTEYTVMEHWNELPALARSAADDHLMVIVTARKGTVSYKNAMEKLPEEVARYQTSGSLMIIFPDQFGTSDFMTFAAPKL